MSGLASFFLMFSRTGLLLTFGAALVIPTVTDLVRPREKPPLSPKRWRRRLDGTRLG